MMKTRFTFLLGRIILGMAAIGLIVSGVILSRARQARFNVDALEQYLQAYRLVEHKPIESLSALPDFSLMSLSENISLKSGDLKQGIKGGYIYDYQYLSVDQFVISASPGGVFSLFEFGITDSGILRMNNKDVDAQADSREEVEKWPAITRQQQIRTKDQPSYLNN